MPFSISRRFIYVGAVLALLAPAVFLGLQRTKVYASAPAASTPIAGSTIASSKYGPISLVVSGGTGSTVSLSVSVGKLFYSFTLPARDFTQNASSATLDTHGDLKSYGTIRITWTKRTVHVPATKGNSCGVKAQPARNIVTLVNGKGTANLHLPCLSALTLNFGTTVRVSAPGKSLSGVGSYQGIIGTFSFTMANSSSLSLTLRKSANASKKVDLLGFASHSYTSSTGSAPLQTVSQSFHTGVPASRVSFQSDLSAGTLNFAGGPKMLRGTNIQMSALGNAIPNTGSKGTACTKPTKGGGATRTVKLQGSLSVHLCAISGNFTVNSTGSFGSLYSSSLTVQAPKPLKVVSIVPADKATGVATSTTQVVVTFSNQMSTQNASLTLTSTSTTSPDFMFIQNPTLDASKKMMTFTLPRALKASTTYNVQVFAMDLSQQSVTNKTTFTTGS